MFQVIPAWRVQFVAPGDETKATVTLRTPADDLETLVGVLRFSGVTDMALDLERGIPGIADQEERGGR